MKLIENKLYIEFSELVDCGFPIGTVKSAQFRNSNSWKFIDDPDDKRKVLSEYESMKPTYKEKVIAKYGNPYEYLAKVQIKKRK